MKPQNNYFSNFFKQKRKETHLTQRELAQKAGVGLRFIRDVEQGKRTVRLDRVNRVLALFGYCAGPHKCSPEQDGADGSLR